MTTTATLTTTTTNTSSTTTPFQSSQDLRTLVTSTRSLLPPSEDYHPREERYWNNDQTHYQPLQHTETLGIQQLALSPQRTLAATGGPRISFWTSPLDKSLHHTQQRFSSAQIKAKQISTSGQLTTAVAFRHDGQLMAVGNLKGQVQIIQCATRAVLTTWSCSTLPIRAVVWQDDQTVWVGGDDARLSKWSLQSTKPTPITYAGHGDGITCIRLQDEYVVSVSADHTVRLWMKSPEANDEIQSNDIDTKEALAVWRHAGPVQDIVWVPSSVQDTNAKSTACCITASGTELTVWNPNHVQLLQQVPTRHVKTITALCYILRRRRKTNASSSSKKNEEEDDFQHCVFTAALDGALRLHEWNPQTRQLVSLIRLSLPSQQPETSTPSTMQRAITALTVFSHRGCIVLACGFSHGQVLLRTTAPPPTVMKRRVQEPPAGTYAYFMRGPRVPLTTTTDDLDTTVVAATGNKKRKYKSYDLCLKQFRYADALDEALATRNAQTVLNVLEALGQRPNGLDTALSNASTLEPLISFCLSFLRKQHTQHQHATTCVLGVLNECWRRRANNEADELWWKIRQAVQQEVQTQTCLLRTLGQIDGLLGTRALEGNQTDDD
ncbi:U3 small nucleolar RNA-associated protein 15 [Fistulifera solaris]|uniref:U3 small nucleolar RNA-associated protein 15 n=1 Tax=Fistulifera solaris TaxID=1519565 RepID=A0A1Z5JD38_FISSO|nr:U3 small nucleolar RNA-associated protein 15 [Fistulifera solaris]|eukprot:GAX11930.1 U3 small nucleolar RNA-associated protein 15 [Fistulifera solaris]